MFECKLQKSLADLPGVFVIRGDNLIVGYGDNEEESLVNHDENVEKFMQRAKEVNLKLNKTKMNLRKAEVKFMGHVITREGMKQDPDKITATAKVFTQIV